MQSPPTGQSDDGSLFEKGARVLFQGDSITDMGRGRTEDPNHLLGHGYAFIIAAMEAAYYPARAVTFVNRGVSGNTSEDLAARWQRDTLELDPDVLSILIGVNDVGHTLGEGRPFSIENYEITYDRLLAEAIRSAPRVRLILGEPFLGSGSGTAAQFEQRQSAMEAIRAVVGKLAGRYRAPVVHYQRMFDEAAKRAPAEYWIWDGIHPTFAGHQLMADEWRRTYRDFYGPAAVNTPLTDVR
jgi:lysophospholipase L1-like esterase